MYEIALKILSGVLTLFCIFGTFKMLPGQTKRAQILFQHNMLQVWKHKCS